MFYFTIFVWITSKIEKGKILLKVKHSFKSERLVLFIGWYRFDINELYYRVKTLHS